MACGCGQSKAPAKPPLLRGSARLPPPPSPASGRQNFHLPGRAAADLIFPGTEQDGACHRRLPGARQDQPAESEGGAGSAPWAGSRRAPRCPCPGGIRESRALFRPSGSSHRPGPLLKVTRRVPEGCAHRLSPPDPRPSQFGSVLIGAAWPRFFPCNSR